MCFFVSSDFVFQWLHEMILRVKHFSCEWFKYVCIVGVSLFMSLDWLCKLCSSLRYE